MIMATVHSTLKARSGRNSPRKKLTKRPAAVNRAEIAAERKVKRVQAAKVQRSASQGPGSQTAERVFRIRVRGRLQEMIRVQLSNLGKAESVLRCLALSMDCQPLEHGSPYYPDVAEVVGDLVKRSLVDLDTLYDGRLPEQLMAAPKIER
jgi:hypothetical protein